MSCSHLRQRKLPCATPGCDDTIDDNEIQAEVINARGIKRGLGYSSRGVPEEFRSQVSWSRASWPLLGDGSGHPLVKLLGRSPSVYFWAPIVGGKDGLFTRGLDSSIAVYCPQCASLLGKTKLYRRGVPHFIGCATCDQRFRITYHKKDGLVGWSAGGEFVGYNNAVSVVEYPNEDPA